MNEANLGSNLSKLLKRSVVICSFSKRKKGYRARSNESGRGEGSAEVRRSGKRRNCEAVVRNRTTELRLYPENS